MTTEPTVTCTVCGASRGCQLHTRADHPPTAAKKWLRKNCRLLSRPCEFGYRAGVDVDGMRRALRERKPTE